MADVDMSSGERGAANAGGEYGYDKDMSSEAGATTSANQQEIVESDREMSPSAEKNIKTIQNLFYPSKYYNYSLLSDIDKTKCNSGDCSEQSINDLYNSLHSVHTISGEELDVSLYPENDTIFNKVKKLLDLIK